jgi:glycosyltransferase involved in cell wall biosynthesis
MVKVSVILITYNHERYIRQALDSVLSQQTSFEFEVIITEDCSTDATREIVLEYAQRYPDKIRLMLSETNVCTPWVLERAIIAAHGQYVAYLDGDDYWTSPHKLQNQVDLMDAHPGYVLSWHTAEWVDADGTRLSEQPEPLEQSTFTIRDFLMRDPNPATSSMMMRNPIPEIPQWYRSCSVGDFPLWTIALQYGTACFFDASLSAYRIHPKGAYNGLGDIQKAEINLSCYRLMFQNLDPSYRPFMKERLALWWETLARGHWQQGNSAAARRVAREGVRDCPTAPKLLLMAYAPWLWRWARARNRLKQVFTGRRQRRAAGT